jgi:hypothetical protein
VGATTTGVEGEQRRVGARLGREDVEAGAGSGPAAERLGQCRLVEQAARARR